MTPCGNSFSNSSAVAVARSRLVRWIAGSRAAGRVPTRLLTEDEIAAFRRDGFVTVPAITTAEELDTLRGAYDRYQSARGSVEYAEQPAARIAPVSSPIARIDYSISGNVFNGGN